MHFLNSLCPVVSFNSSNAEAYIQIFENTSKPRENISMFTNSDGNHDE